jgi:hypothetical protein
MLDEAVQHFRDAGCAPPDVRGALKNHYRAADLDLGPDPEPQPEKVSTMGLKANRCTLLSILLATHGRSHFTSHPCMMHCLPSALSYMQTRGPVDHGICESSCIGFRSMQPACGHDVVQPLDGLHPCLLHSGGRQRANSQRHRRSRCRGDAVKGLPSLGPKPKGGASKKEAAATA